MNIVIYEPLWPVVESLFHAPLQNCAIASPYYVVAIAQAAMLHEEQTLCMYVMINNAKVVIVKKKEDKKCRFALERMASATLCLFL